MLVIDDADPCLHGALPIIPLCRVAVVVERAASQTCNLEQVCQFMVMPQPGNQTRFVGAADLFDRIKACNFFRYATSARSRSGWFVSAIGVVSFGSKRSKGCLLPAVADNHYAFTMAPSSSPTHWPNGRSPRASPSITSSQASPPRTPISNASTRPTAPGCWTGTCLTHSRKCGT